MAKINNNRTVSAVEVYLERRRSRERVGTLYKSKVDGKTQYEFKYEKSYLMRDNAIPLGPEFPLTQEKFANRKLFQSFDDRIPSRKNPAYPEYCKAFGISPEETESFLLLTTIGRKGPSSFVFEAANSDNERKVTIAEFRKMLGLTIREFAAVFDTSTVSVQKLERGERSAKELMKRLQIYLDFPEVALWEVKRNRAKIHDDKFQDMLRRLEDQERTTAS